MCVPDRIDTYTEDQMLYEFEVAKIVSSLSKSEIYLEREINNYFVESSGIKKSHRSMQKT